MSGFENIEALISEYKAKVNTINQALLEEKNKSYDKRRMKRICFLHAEKRAHLQTLNELNKLFPGSTGKGEDDSSFDFSQELAFSFVDTNAREWKHTKTGKQIYRISAWGGIGDALLLTPALRSLKQQYPDCKIYVYCRKWQLEALLHNKYIDRLHCSGRLSGLINGFRYLLEPGEIRVVSYGDLMPSLLYHTHASEIIGEMLGVKIDSARLDCFLTEEEESEAKKVVERYSNPVCINVTPRCSPNKSWPTENWERFVLNSPQYTFLQLGSSEESHIPGTINMCGKTSLRQAFAIVKEARAFVGVDSALSHAAAAFNKPAVVLFGPSTPVVWGHSTAKNLYKPPRCSPCIDVILQMSCPYGTPCMSNITVSDVERALSSLMDAETND